MNAVQRFFRKYFFSTMGILLLFFLVNAVLAGVVLITACNNSTAPTLSVSELADMVTEKGGAITAKQEVSDVLADNNAWAMLLDDDGMVIWEERMPDNLPRSYTSTDIAKFTRWYLRDYPVYVWEHPSGLFVLAYPKNSMQKYNFSADASYLSTNIIGLITAFIVNVLLMLLLFWHSTHKVEKAVRPILTGINTMAQGKPVVLEEHGELAEINAELNRAGEQLQKKDTARAEWINGVSHDIRTPLSIILGYAGEMEDDSSLPAEVQKQAGIIRKQSEKLRQLINDLNLASKLEYSMQPMKRTLISPVELSRQTMSDFINNGLDERYTLELNSGAGVDKVLIEGDNTLLFRMLGNIIGNSIGHNPDGCNITISVEVKEPLCIIIVQDTGYKLVVIAMICCLMFSFAGCSLLDNMDKDKVLGTYNDIISSAGKSLLTKDLSLQGDRDFGTDKYVGTYTSDYNAFTGTEYLFGGTFIERETGKDLIVTCTFDISEGTAQLFWLCGSDDPVALLEGSGEYSETIEMPEGGNYFGITGDNLKGNVELTIMDKEAEAD